MSEFVLDYIDGIKLPEGEGDSHFEARMALARLAGGLFWLHDEMIRLERRAKFSAQQDNVQYGLVGGVLDGFPLGFLSCAFQWYAVSACNYARLVGWLANGDHIKAGEYVRSVMPTLQQYRNKVAAHFAITDPRGDNEADLLASLFTQVVYVQGYLCAGALTQIVPSGDSDVGASRNLSWSLTHTHRNLMSRYWPSGAPPAYQSLRVPGNSAIRIDVRLPDDLAAELGYPPMPAPGSRRSA